MRQRGKTLPQLGGAGVDVAHECIIHGIQHSAAACTDDRVAAKGGTVRAGTHGIGNLFACQHGTDGQTAAQPLGQGDEIRLQAELLAGQESAGTAHAGLYFVHNNQNIVGVAVVGNALHIVGVQRNHAAFALYQLPLRAVAYPFVLCAAAGAVLLTLDYRRVLRQHRRLELLRQLPEELADALPPSDTVTEADYRSLVTLLAESRRAIRTQEEQRYGDMVDYYTMWAHQIKTPIASMRLTLQNEDSDLARSLSGDLMRVEQYVEMVLVFLRLDSSTTDYVIRAHSLDDIVRPAVRKFAGEFIRRRLRLDYQPLDRTVVTDAKWLGFVVEQVLSNALKYTAQGSVTIAMDGDDLCIRDTGMGIAPEDLPRIFDRGFTGLNGRRDTRASGIGLYLCRRICRSLGHTIRASSVPNQGTEIRIGLGQKKTLPE